MQDIGLLNCHIPFVDLPCKGLDKALSTVRVPMPGPGEQFEVPAELLSAEEKVFLDRFAAGRFAAGG